MRSLIVPLVGLMMLASAVASACSADGVTVPTGTPSAVEAIAGLPTSTMTGMVETPAPVTTATATSTPTTSRTPTQPSPPTPTPTQTQMPTPRPTHTPTISPSPVLPANPLGSVLVLEYHMIGEPEGRWQRTPENLRADIERLHRLGYTPANIIDLSLGFPDLPPGKKPVVLTFDDSDISQFRYQADGSIDPDSAVGILYEFHQEHPQDWPLKGTFYVLQDVNAPERVLFGQPELADQKLRWLVEHGFEVGSHTISHFDLAAGSDDEVQWQLAVSQRQLEARLPGYDVRSLSVPFGNYPANESLLAWGQWTGTDYAYANTVMVAGGASPSPHSAEFDPFHIPRVQALQNELDYWLGFFEQNPEFYYVSGGR